MLEFFRHRRAHLTIYARATGLKLASLGDTWVVFNDRSGETVQLNNEAAAVLEVLGESGLDELVVSALISKEAGVNATQVADQLVELWPQLVALGFVDALD
jgi:PqqD family protein of HPr-rel-A system